MHDYLKKILNNKQREVKAYQHALQTQADVQSQAILNNEIKYQGKKSFKNALQTDPIAIIAEIKRRSPSKSHLADIPDPVSLANQYVQGGAAAISVLTDSFGFNGSLQDLTDVSEAIKAQPQPVLRKDFIIDPIQIPQAIVAGADAVLLIVAVLKEKTADFIAQAKALNIDALVEVHDQTELDWALQMGAEIVGINNRNLTTFEVDTQNAIHLKKMIPNHIITVAESGIQDVSTAQMYRHAGFNALLIGEALVKADNPADFISAIMQGEAP